MENQSSDISEVSSASEIETPSNGFVKLFTLKSDNRLYGKLSSGLVIPLGTAYKSYTILASQQGTNNPTVKILDNTLGEIDFVRVGDISGHYKFVSDGLFKTDKTFLVSPNFIPNANGKVYGGQFIPFLGNENEFHFFTAELQTGVPPSLQGDPQDNILNNTPIEIRVYN